MSVGDENYHSLRLMDDGDFETRMMWQTEEKDAEREKQLRFRQASYSALNIFVRD